MNFTRNQLVEVCMTEKGLKESYYEARIMRTLPHNHMCHVQFEELLDDNEFGPLRELVLMNFIRPIPPSLLVLDFEEGDVVDAKFNDGWWKGVVVGKEGDGFVVHFDEQDEDWGFPFEMLRLHQEYVDGKWVY